MISSGKSSLTKILSDRLGTTPFYEPVKDNPVLPLFYKGNEKLAVDREKGIMDTTNPYTFLLQIYFLNIRFRMIKEAMKQDNNILDRSIYEDKVFMKMNYDMGNTTKTELDMYQDLFNNMMEELPYAAHKKSPDLMIMIRVNYDTMIKRVVKRGRDFEQLDMDPSLEQYYKNLIKYYDDFIENYDESELLVIDGDKYDFVENKEDLKTVMTMIADKLISMGNINDAQYKALVGD